MASATMLPRQRQRRKGGGIKYYLAGGDDDSQAPNSSFSAPSNLMMAFCLTLLAVISHNLSPVMAQMPAIQIQGGFINVAIPAPVSGVLAVDAIAAVDGMEVAQSIINARNLGKGVKIADRLATEVYVKFKISVLDSGSDRSRHLSVTSTAANSSRGAYNGAPYYNPISIDPIDKFPDYNVLVGVHPAYSVAEAVLSTQAGLITMQCCTPSPVVYTTTYGQDARFLFGMQRSYSVYANNFLAAMARRGVRKVALVYSVTDPSSEEACLAVKAAATTNDITVPYTLAYDYGLGNDDLPYVWGATAGLGRPRSGDTGISGGASASDPAISQSPREAQLELFAENLVGNLKTRGITTIVHCGQPTDTAIIMKVVLGRRKYPLDGLYSFPAPIAQRNASSSKQWQQHYESDVLSPRGFSAGTATVADPTAVRGVSHALMPAKLLELGVERRDSRYLMTAAPWTSDVRYNDSQLVDAATFVSEFRRLKRYDPPWQAAAGAATLTVLATALEPIFLDCEVLYPRILMMLQDPAAAPCGPGTLVNPYMRWRARIEAGKFDTIFGVVQFNGSHVNEALQPLLLQAQAVGTLQQAASNELDGLGLSIVAPVTQARYIGGVAPKMPTGETLVVDPPAASVVYPAPGSLYLGYLSAFGISTIVVGGISLLTLLFLLRVLCKHRYKTAVRKAKFNVLVLTMVFGIMVTGWLATFLGPANEATCNARVMVPTVALSCVLAPLMGKAVHARMQFFSVKAMGMWKFKAKHTWIWLAWQLAIDGALLALWYLRGSFQVFRATCVSLDAGADFFFHAGIFGWKMVQAGLAALAVWTIRYITLPYDDGHYMAIVAYHMVAALGLGIGAYSVITMGPWNTVHESLAVSNYQYSFPRPVTSSALENILGSPEEAYLAGSIAIIVFAMWICWFTVSVTIYRKFKEAFAERNTIAEAAALRKRAKREATASLSRRLQAVAPDGTKSDSAFSFGGKKGANYSAALAAKNGGDGASSKASELKEKSLRLLSGGFGRIPKVGGFLASKVDSLRSTSTPTAGDAAATSPGAPSVSLGGASTTVGSPPVSPVALKVNNDDGSTTSPSGRPTIVTTVGNNDNNNNPRGNPTSPGAGIGAEAPKTPGGVSMSRTGGGGGVGGALLTGGAGFRVKEAEDKLRAAQQDNKQLRDSVIFLRSQVELLKNEVLRAVEASANQARAAATFGAAAANQSAPSPAGRKKRPVHAEVVEGSPQESKDGDDEDEDDDGAEDSPRVPAANVTIPGTAAARRASDMLLGLALADARRASVVRALDMPAEVAQGMLTKKERRASAVATAIALETMRGEALAAAPQPTPAATNGRRASFVTGLRNDEPSSPSGNAASPGAAPRRGSVVNLAAPKSKMLMEPLDDGDGLGQSSKRGKKKSARRLKKKQSSRSTMLHTQEGTDEAAGIVDSSDEDAEADGTDDGEEYDEESGSDDENGERQTSSSGGAGTGLHEDDALGIAQTTASNATDDHHDHHYKPSSYEEGVIRGKWNSSRDAEVQTDQLVPWDAANHTHSHSHSSRASTPTTAASARRANASSSSGAHPVVGITANKTSSKAYSGTLWRNIASGGASLLLKEAAGRAPEDGYSPPSARDHLSASFKAQLADGQVLDGTRTTPLRRINPANGGMASMVLSPASSPSSPGSNAEASERLEHTEATDETEHEGDDNGSGSVSGSHRSGTGTGAGTGTGDDQQSGSYYSGTQQSGSYQSGTGTGDWTQTGTTRTGTVESSIGIVAGMSAAVMDSFSRKTQKLMAWAEEKAPPNPLANPTNPQRRAELEAEAAAGAGEDAASPKKEKGDVSRFMRGKPKPNKFALDLDDKKGPTHKEGHDAILDTFIRAKSTLSKVPLGATDEELREAVSKGIAIPTGLKLESTGISAEDALSVSFSPKAVARPWRNNKAELADTEKALAAGTASAAVASLVRDSSKSPSRNTQATPGAPPPPPIPLMPNEVPAENHGVDPLAHVILGPSLSASMAQSAQDMLNPLTKRTPLAIAVAAAAEATQVDNRKRLLEGTLGVGPASPIGPGGSSAGAAYLSATAVVNAKQQPRAARAGTGAMTAATNATGASSPERDSTAAQSTVPAARLAAAARPVSMSILAANKALLEAEAALEARQRRELGLPSPRK